MALKVNGMACSLRDGLLEGVVRYAVELGATRVGGPLSRREEELVSQALSLPRPSKRDLEGVRDLVARGHDPLGQAICGVLSPAERRGLGVVYTPFEIVRPMVAWVLKQSPVRVVDAGCGSGRFVTAVLRMNPYVELIAVDLDPLATLVCRANAAVIGAKNLRVLQEDYTEVDLQPVSGRTAFIGNPPYVRHHMIPSSGKARALQTARSLNLSMSQLAGLHVHFYLSTARCARPGDVGCFVTSAEWLDVGYGKVLRHLLTGPLAVESLHLIDPTSKPFADAMTTALITTFRIGVASPLIRFKVVSEASELRELDTGGRAVDRAEVVRTPRWRPFFSWTSTTPCSSHDRTAHSNPLSSLRSIGSSDMVPLGSLVRVSRGVATGCNSFFVLAQHEVHERGLTPFARQAVTSAKEILNSGGVIRGGPQRKVLLDLPASLYPGHVGTALAKDYVEEGERGGIHKRYLCAHRKPWWALRIQGAPPALATYMARQAPVFALNPDALIPLNIAHGLYPRVRMGDEELMALIHYLNAARSSFRGEGRTYQGGLEKFEPREMEALLVPSLLSLRRIAEAIHGAGKERA